LTSYSVIRSRAERRGPSARTPRPSPAAPSLRPAGGFRAPVRPRRRRTAGPSRRRDHVVSERADELDRPRVHDATYGMWFIGSTASQHASPDPGSHGAARAAPASRGRTPAVPANRPACAAPPGARASPGPRRRHPVEPAPAGDPGRIEPEDPVGQEVRWRKSQNSQPSVPAWRSACWIASRSIVSSEVSGRRSDRRARFGPRSPRRRCGRPGARRRTERAADASRCAPRSPTRSRAGKADRREAGSPPRG